MANEVKLTFAGDSSQLQKETATASTSADKMADSVQQSSSRMGKAWAGTHTSAEFLAEGISNLGSGIQAVTDLSRDSEIRADRLARANNDVAQAAADVQQAMQDSAQALLDWSQAGRDTAQAAIDVEQAQLDAEAAQQDYNAAVKEFGPKSLEARQALIDQKQANEDLAQAQMDAKQAELDQQQALLDTTQSTIDAKSATIDLNETRREAVPPSGLQEWTEKLSGIAPVALTAMGAIQLMSTSSAASAVASGAASAASGVWTGVQWLLNAAFWASPITWIVAGIIALIAVIVLIATKTTWFQDIWRVVWGGIKTAAKAVADWFSGPFAGFFVRTWDAIVDKAKMVQDYFRSIPERIKAALSGVADAVSWPFRTGFNMVSTAWNNTVGKLSWTIPSWVPIVGGNTISAPKLPKFHEGIDRVPGVPGQEMLAILEAGERVIPADRADADGGGGDTFNLTFNVSLKDIEDIERLIEWLREMRNRMRRGLVVTA